MTSPSFDKNRFIQFSQFSATLKLPFCIYANFKCLTQPIMSCEPLDTKSFTLPFQKHVAYCVAYTVVCSFDLNLNVFQLYRGENPERWFVNKLKEESARLSQLMKVHSNKPLLPLTDEELRIVSKTKNCSTCNINFSSNKNIKQV